MRLLNLLWYSLPVRWQILLAVAMLGMLAALIATAAAAFEARQRAKVEMAASMELAGRLLKETHLAAGLSIEESAAKLGRQLQHLRHVRIALADASGRLHTVLPHPGEVRGGGWGIHRWLAEAAGSGADPREIVMTSDTGVSTRAVLAGEPADEFAEVWNDLSKLLLFWAGASAMMMLALYIVLGRIFGPLVTLAGGMQSLGAGRFGVRVTPPKAKELAGIAESFNTLAAALNAAQAENRRLYRNLITVQESERREIASELHDELGPCLFGLTANAASIEAMSEALPDGMRDKITDRAGQIQSITARLKTMNRALLKKLRPAALGQVSLAELIGELLSGMERLHPGVELVRRFSSPLQSYGEEVDLVIYRCVQEGVTNANRHGKARRVVVELREEMEVNGTGEERGKQLILRLSDDGEGIPAPATAGFGLSTMRERVEAAGGSFAMTGLEPRGTAISVNIPLDGGKRRGQEDRT